MSTEIGLFYGSTTGMTEDVAFRMEESIRNLFPQLEVSAINIIDLEDPKDMFLPDKIILGMPTWNYGEFQDDWEMVIDQIASVNLQGKTIAMFGLGDQIGYPEYYLDALGMIGEQLKAQGATFVGAWPSAGYKFTRSKALLPDGNFIGLALDEDSQPELTDERINQWLSQVIPQLLAN